MHAGLACQYLGVVLGPTWEKASLVSGTSIWDEPNNHELIGRGPTADAESERACKRVGEDVGLRKLAGTLFWTTAIIATFVAKEHGQDSATSSAEENPTPAQYRTTTHAPPNVFQLQNRRFFLFQEAAMWLPEKVFQQLAEVEVAHLTQANKYLEEFIQNNKVQRDPVQGKSEIRLPSSSRRRSRRGPNRQEVESLVQAAEETALRQRNLWAMRQGSTWHRWTRHCSWVPCLAPLRSQEVCHIGIDRESHKTPCRSCPPNRTCRSRQSAHPYSSVGFASKCMRHSWEGTIHQHTAIWADHRRRTQTKQGQAEEHRLLGDTPRAPPNGL